MTSIVVPLTRDPDRPHVYQDRLLVTRINETGDCPVVHLVELHRMRKETDPPTAKEFLELLFVEVTDERAIAGLRDTLIADCLECHIP